jgi:hypothetical protein
MKAPVRDIEVNESFHCISNKSFQTEWRNWQLEYSRKEDKSPQTRIALKVLNGKNKKHIF